MSFRIPADPHRRPGAIDGRLLGWFALASAPALVLGLANLGRRVLTSPAAEASDALNRLGPGADEPAWLATLAAGAAFLVPRLAVASVVSLFWAGLFARLRGLRLDPGWFISAWLFTLLLPAGIPLSFVVWGLSFGLVFGCHVFGGTGRYIVSPALLGAVFLTFAYPSAMDGQWVPGTELTTTWSVAAGEGLDAVLEAGTTWLDVALGREVAALGTPAALACLAGAAFLIGLGLASWRIVIGGLVGLAAVGACFDGLSWHWQPVLGGFAFALAFIATDPTTCPTSRPGQWTLGLVFGAVTAAIRMLNPEHPDGALSALLLATLLVPLVDHLADHRSRSSERPEEESRRA